MTSELQERVRRRFADLARPCAEISVQEDVAPRQASGSCLGGLPYLPAGQSWPHDHAGPMAFIAQLNFAQVPALPGFPGSGLLQWFVSTEDGYGLAYRPKADHPGFVLRWLDDLTGPSSPHPQERAASEQGSPTLVRGALAFAPGVSLPCWAELSDEERSDPLWPEAGAILRDPDGDPDTTYTDLVDLPGVGPPRYVDGSKVGGYAAFTQTDPRGAGRSYPAASAPEGRLLVQLDSVETGGWGDSGIAHLFGDPAALSHGDLSGVRYHWDCC